MIGSLNGVVEEINSNHIILNVGNIGYIVYLSAKTIRGCCTGSRIKLFITTYINSRENTNQLYGFTTKEEQQCLCLLIKVSGVSYKTAMLLLSKLTPEELILAIKNEDKTTLKIRGLSTKLINRIVTELNSKVNKLKMDDNNICSKIDKDALSALINLGYKKTRAHDAIKKYNLDLGTKEIIRMALRELSQHHEV